MPRGQYIFFCRYIFPKKPFRKIILQLGSNNLAEWKKRTRSEKGGVINRQGLLYEGCDTGYILNHKFLTVVWAALRAGPN